MEPDERGARNQIVYFVDIQGYQQCVWGDDTRDSGTTDPLHSLGSALRLTLNGSKRHVRRHPITMIYGSRPIFMSCAVTALILTLPSALYQVTYHASTATQGTCRMASSGPISPGSCILSTNAFYSRLGSGPFRLPSATCQLQRCALKCTDAGIKISAEAIACCVFVMVHGQITCSKCRYTQEDIYRRQETK